MAVATITFTGKNPCRHEIETTIEVTVRPLLKLQTCAVQLRPLLILVVTSAISRFQGQTALHCACCFAQAQLMVLAAEVMMSSVQVRPKAKFIVTEGNEARFS